jgi:hypothetical protein
MLRSRLALIALATVLAVRLAAADPAFRVTPLETGVRVEIEGSYSGALYSVSRATDPLGDYQRLSGSGDVLCIGACYAYDSAVLPGNTYWYRFDLRTADGMSVSFGPYSTTIPTPPPIAIKVTPNPGSGPVRIDLQLTRAALSSSETELALFDLTGRRVATIDRQTMGTGVRTVTWNGRLDDGRVAPAGLYLLRFSSGDGHAMTVRLARIR